MESPNDFFDSIVDNAPSPGTLFLILDKMKREGTFGKVIRICTKALSVYPNEIQLRKLLAETYIETGQVLQAEAELILVTGLINEIAHPYKDLAMIYEKQGRYDEALGNIKIYLAHHPSDEDAVRLLKSIESAIGFHEEELSDSGPFPEIHDTSTAEDLASREEQDLPEIATATLAEIYYSQGQIQEAVATYEKMIEKNPEDHNAVKRLDELREVIKIEETAVPPLMDLKRHRTEKLINALESWKSVLREH